jgi:hypothetical protein
MKWVYVGLALGVAGCAGTPDSKAGSAAEARRGPEPISPPKADHERVVDMDLNTDGKPDVWVYTVPDGSTEGPGRVVRKERDLNGDGRVDLTTYYEGGGQKQREAMDLDFDGKVDSVFFYEGGLNVRRERDLDGDGRADVWLYYEKEKLVRKERDSNQDGKVDYWEYWEGDQVDRVGEDLNGDGTVDKWKSRTAPAASAPPEPAAPAQ